MLRFIGRMNSTAIFTGFPNGPFLGACLSASELSQFSWDKVICRRDSLDISTLLIICVKPNMRKNFPLFESLFMANLKKAKGETVPSHN